MTAGTGSTKGREKDAKAGGGGCERIDMTFWRGKVKKECGVGGERGVWEMGNLGGTEERSVARECRGARNVKSLEYFVGRVRRECE